MMSYHIICTYIFDGEVESGMEDGRVEEIHATITSPESIGAVGVDVVYQPDMIQQAFKEAEEGHLKPTPLEPMSSGSIPAPPAPPTPPAPPAPPTPPAPPIPPTPPSPPTPPAAPTTPPPPPAPPIAPPPPPAPQVPPKVNEVPDVPPLESGEAEVNEDRPICFGGYVDTDQVCANCPSKHKTACMKAS